MKFGKFPHEILENMNSNEIAFSINAISELSKDGLML